MSNLQSNGLGLLFYRPRLEGRMAEMTVYFTDGRYNGKKGINVKLEIVRGGDGGRSYGYIEGDPSFSMIVLPFTRYSKKRYIEALKQLDPHVPELTAAYEADQQDGERKLRELAQKLFGISLAAKGESR